MWPAKWGASTLWRTATSLGSATFFTHRYSFVESSRVYFWLEHMFLNDPHIFGIIMVYCFGLRMAIASPLQIAKHVSFLWFVRLGGCRRQDWEAFGSALQLRCLASWAEMVCLKGVDPSKYSLCIAIKHILKDEQQTYMTYSELINGHLRKYWNMNLFFFVDRYRSPASLYFLQIGQWSVSKSFQQDMEIQTAKIKTNQSWSKKSGSVEFYFHEFQFYFPWVSNFWMYK